MMSLESADAPTPELFGTRQAAEYLGLTERGLEYHIYEVKDLQPDAKIGQALVFTRETLDAFQQRRRPPGRPPKDGSQTRETKPAA